MAWLRQTFLVRATQLFGDQTGATPNLVVTNLAEPKRRLIDETITLGDETGVYAQARLQEIRPGVFTLVPIFFQADLASRLPGQVSRLGQPIKTRRAITNLEQAHHALELWATQALSQFSTLANSEADAHASQPCKARAINRKHRIVRTSGNFPK